MKLTIALKLRVAFGIILFGLLINGLLTFYKVNKSKTLNQKYQEIFKPSAEYIDDLYKLTTESQFLIKNWVWVEKKDINESTDKLRLVEIIYNDFPNLKKNLYPLTKTWEAEYSDKYEEIIHSLNYIFENHEYIMYELLNNFSNYEDPTSFLEASILVDADAGEIMLETKDVLEKIAFIREKQNKLVEVTNQELITSFNQIGTLILILTILTTVIFVIIGIITTNSIVKPINNIKNNLLILAKGKLPQKFKKITRDEIGKMSKAMNILINSFQRTSDFAKNIGLGNFDYKFNPLSEDDILGNSLILMKEQLQNQICQLKENEELLEQKVIERTQKVSEQKLIIEKKNNDITASINYALRIQRAILPQVKVIKENFDDALIYFQPRDIVSGDFYWFTKIDSKKFVAAVDCTGHSIPGAFMSMIGNTLLNEIVINKKVLDTDIILDKLNEGVLNTFQNQEDIEKEDEIDGMDISICCFDDETKEVTISSANHLIYKFTETENNEIIKGSINSIGSCFVKSNNYKYSKYHIKIKEPIYLYLFSDGYPDQFGGKYGYKFLQKRFYDMLEQNYYLSMDKQYEILDKTLNDWKGDRKQIDDILVIGIKYS